MTAGGANTAALVAALVLACALTPLADGSHDRPEVGAGRSRRGEGLRPRLLRLVGGGSPPPGIQPTRGEEGGVHPPGGVGARASNPSAAAEGGEMSDEADRAQGLRWLADLAAAERKSGWAIRLYNMTADATSLRMLSRVLAEARGDLEQARSVAARALEVEPGSAEGMKLCAQAMLGGPGSRESDEADALLRHVLELDPADVEAACLLGRGLIARGQGRAAAETCQAALQHVKDPQAYARGLHGCANVMRDAGRLSDAQRAYERLLGVTPDAAVLCDFALLRERMVGTRAAGQPAAELYQHALAACPTHTSALINYANLDTRGGTIGSVSADEARGMLRAAMQGSPDSIPACMGLAAHLLADGQGEAAAEITREAVRKFDTSFAVLSRHAYVMHCTGRLEEAQATYRAAIKASPTHADTVFNLATLQHARAMSSKGGALRGEAERLYKRALELDPQHAEAALNLGVLLHVQGSSEADRWLSRASGLIPKHIPTLTTYAGVLAEGGASNRSLQLYRRAMVLDPHNKELLLQFARFQERHQKNVAEAGELYRRIIEMDPTDVQAMVECASMLHDVGTGTSEARAIYVSALSVNPTSSAVLFGIGHVAESDGDLKEAEEFYRRAIVSDPGHVNAWNNYGRILDTHRGDYLGAERAYEAALRINPKHSLGLYNYGSMLQTQGRLDRAEELYRRFLQLCVPHKVHASVLCNYGLLLEESMTCVQTPAQSRKYDLAEQKYKQALLLDPTETSTMVNYASLLHEGRGDTEGASALYKRALSLSPADTTALCSYGRMLHRLAKNQRAEEMFQRSLRHEPTHVPSLVSYAALLKAVSRDLAKAKRLLETAQQLNPQVAQDYLAL